jgi:hypothetical protein
MSFSVVDYEPLAADVKCTRDALVVVLEDGRQISVPLAWFPRLQNATPAQRKNWRLIGGGIGIHWEDMDEDVSIESLLALK